MKIKTIASGSSGNCYVISSGQEKLILEAGVSFKEIQIEMEFDFSSVCGCLVSHEHLDHSKAIKDLTKRSINVYSAQDTFTYLGIKSHRAKPVEAGKMLKIGSFSIIPFQIVHNALYPLGFLIRDGYGETLLFATDTAYLKHKFKGLNYIMIECNYNEDILKEELNTGKIDQTRYNRLVTSHMSYERVVKMLETNDLTNVKEIHLLHMSASHCDSELCRSGIESKFGIKTSYFGG